MIYFLLVIIIALLCIIFYQQRHKRNRDLQLDYVYQKLTAILSNNTKENLLLFTDDKQLIPLLKSINHLLNSNQKVLADYSATQEATNKMISNISHDLKTPLTVISGYLEMVALDETVPTDEQKKIHKAYKKAEELQTLISEFFDLAKLESGDAEISLEKVHLNEVCKKCLLNFYETLENNLLDVSINIPDKNLYCIANEEALKRALNNLFSNAIKYGFEGNVIGLNLKEDKNYAYIEVWDRGKGFEEKDKEKIFDRLYTLEDSRNKKYQGSGLGLSITKKLVKNMDGKIQVSSKPYDKTVFTLQFKKLVT